MATVELFDLSTLDQNDAFTFELRHPATDDPIPGVTATVYGQDSEQYRAATRKAMHKYTEYPRKHRGKFMPPEEQEVLEFQKTVAITKSINGLTMGGKSITDIGEILTKVPAFKDQIAQESTERANFIKTSAKE